MNLELCGIVTPINKNIKSKSNRDYCEQLERAKQHRQVMWDDAKRNPTHTIGGFFGFVHNGRYVEIHMITDIKPATERLDSWSDNVGQTDRNVLMLTPKIYTISWADWLSLGAPKKVQGTTRVVGAHAQMSSFLKQHINHVTYCHETSETFM